MLVRKYLGNGSLFHEGIHERGVHKVWTEADSVLVDVQGQEYARVMPDANMTIQNIIS